MTYLDPKVWGKHYWFFLDTVAMTYPNHPNDTIKKKYYDFIMNLPLFIPISSISTDFEKLLNLYPVSPYLDNKESLIRWMWFIHNKINEKLEKDKIPLEKFYENYYQSYKSTGEKWVEHKKWKSRLIYLTFIILSVGIIYYFYNQ